MRGPHPEDPPLARFPFRRIALLLLFCMVPAFSWDLVLSGSEGYTHYDAGDFNRVLTLMEKTTKEKGFNPYTVNTFDGHPQNALLLGVRKGPWLLGLEAEFWVEKFTQSEVPFDLENAERNYRVTCDSLRSPDYSSKNLFGCIEASETFDFLPITVQLSYALNPLPWLRVGAGYGIGVLAGSAHIEMTSRYYGANAVPDDKIDFQIWPGVNMVHKAFADIEFLPWDWLGVDWRGGWRISRIEGLTLRNQHGSSRIFSSVFPDAKNGAHMYFHSFNTHPEDDKIYVGTESEARAKAAAEPGSRFHLVNGDFTGWFLALKLNFYWRGL